MQHHLQHGPQSLLISQSFNSTNGHPSAHQSDGGYCSNLGDNFIYGHAVTPTSSTDGGLGPQSLLNSQTDAFGPGHQSLLHPETSNGGHGGHPVAAHYSGVSTMLSNGLRGLPHVQHGVQPQAQPDAHVKSGSKLVDKNKWPQGVVVAVILVVFNLHCFQWCK